MYSNFVASTVRGLQLSMRYEGGGGAGDGQLLLVASFNFMIVCMGRRRKGFFGLKLSQLVDI